MTDELYQVSIPFKRESISERKSELERMAEILKFQFPSNGKAYLNQSQMSKTSIKQLMFQFPSNGKAYLNDNKEDTHGTEKV